MTKEKATLIRYRLDLVERALQFAYIGSAEHSVFLRGTDTEYIPNPFLIIHQLRSDLADVWAEAIR